MKGCQCHCDYGNIFVVFLAVVVLFRQFSLSRRGCSYIAIFYLRVNVFMSPLDPVLIMRAYWVVQSLH